LEEEEEEEGDVLRERGGRRCVERERRKAMC
jgi:hypothetical protein